MELYWVGFRMLLKGVSMEGETFVVDVTTWGEGTGNAGGRGRNILHTHINRTKYHHLLSSLITMLS